MEDFNRELTPGNTKAAMRAIGASSSDLWKIEPSRLRVLEGFNARIKNDAYAARVRWIADSIKKHGDKAADVLLAAMVKSGTGRVTAKHMPDADFKKAIKKQAEPMYTALTKVQADPGFAKLSKEVRELLAELLQGLKPTAE